jgi:prepilin-type N-terminal cleavage/methylation domain-containing protein
MALMMTENHQERFGRRSADQGFSFIELILVTALIGLLSALIVPVFSHTLTNARLKAAAQKTKLMFRYAHTQAISQKAFRWVVVDRDERWVALINEPLQGTRSKADLSSLPTPEKIFHYPEGVALGKIVVQGAEVYEPRSAFVFFPNGSCSGGEIMLHAGTSRSFLVTLDALIGTARIGTDEETTRTRLHSH